MTPDERYCLRIFHGMLDQRAAYDSVFDINSELPDDAENFKYNPDLPEDVDIFNFAFLDRVSRIWQMREDYFNKNKLLVDWFDSYSNIAFQFHMVELYRENFKKALGDDFDTMRVDDMMLYFKALYTRIIMCSEPDCIPDIGYIKDSIDKLDRTSELLRRIGNDFGLPF